MSEIDALIERLEKADMDTHLDNLIQRLIDAVGPDRGIDADIHLLSLGETRETCTLSPGWGALVPHYTKSLDAAMTLLPEGYIWDVFSDWPGDVYWAEIESDNWLPNGKVPTFRGECAATPAIALLIAIMKARKGE